MFLKFPQVGEIWRHSLVAASERLQNLLHVNLDGTFSHAPHGLLRPLPCSSYTQNQITLSLLDAGPMLMQSIHVIFSWSTGDLHKGTKSVWWTLGTLHHANGWGRGLHNSGINPLAHKKIHKYWLLSCGCGNLALSLLLPRAPPIDWPDSQIVADNVAANGTIKWSNTKLWGTSETRKVTGI